MVIDTPKYGRYRVSVQLCWRDELPKECARMAGAVEVLELKRLQILSAAKGRRSLDGGFVVDTDEGLLCLMSELLALTRGLRSSDLYKSVLVTIEAI